MIDTFPRCVGRVALIQKSIESKQHMMIQSLGNNTPDSPDERSSAKARYEALRMNLDRSLGVSLLERSQVAAVKEVS